MARTFSEEQVFNYMMDTQQALADESYEFIKMHPENKEAANHQFGARCHGIQALAYAMFGDDSNLPLTLIDHSIDLGEDMERSSIYIMMVQFIDGIFKACQIRIKAGKDPEEELETFTSSAKVIDNFGYISLTDEEHADFCDYIEKKMFSLKETEVSPDVE